MTAAESGADIHHGAPRCLLGLFDAAGGFADWSESEAEAERLSIEVCGLSREDLRTALIAGSTHEFPTTEHLRLHQGASEFIDWGRRGAEEPWPSTAGRTSRCSHALEVDPTTGASG
jgi:hypothetical protein